MCRFLSLAPALPSPIYHTSIYLWAPASLPCSSWSSKSEFWSHLISRPSSGAHLLIKTQCCSTLFPVLSTILLEKLILSHHGALATVESPVPACRKASSSQTPSTLPSVLSISFPSAPNAPFASTDSFSIGSSIMCSVVEAFRFSFSLLHTGAWIDFCFCLSPGTYYACARRDSSF